MQSYRTDAGTRLSSDVLAAIEYIARPKGTLTADAIYRERNSYRAFVLVYSMDLAILLCVACDSDVELQHAAALMRRLRLLEVDEPPHACDIAFRFHR